MEFSLADLSRLTEVIAPQAEALGFELVRVRLTGTGEERVLQVMAEDPATGQLVVEQCAELSRAISAAMDAIEESGEELVAGAFNLEVSSPGIDRPLTRPKDYAAWIGHEAKVALAEDVGGRRHLHGDLTGIEGDAVTIADRTLGPVTVPLDAVHSAQLVLTDRLIAATRPIDTTGAQEFEEDTQTHEEEKADK